MYQDDQIIEQLGIQDVPEDEQTEIINEAQVRIGEAISEKLTDDQLNEYQAIIDGNEAVISAWLEKNIPEYKDEPVYKSFVEGLETDSEKNSPEKLFTNLAWIQLTVPDIQMVVAEAIEAFKQERAVR
jgi:hypothetical protein